MNNLAFILLIFAVIHFSDKDPAQYALKAAQWLDREVLGFKDLHDNLSRAYAQRVSPAMEALKRVNRHRMQRAAQRSYRLNRCVRKMEKRINAWLNISLRRLNDELADLSKDFMRDARTTRMLAQLKVLHLLEAVNEGAVWDHLTRFGQKWVAVQEMVWVHRMGIELLDEAAKVRAKTDWEIPQRVQQFFREMAVMLLAVNFLGLFQSMVVMVLAVNFMGLFQS